MPRPAESPLQHGPVHEVTKAAYAAGARYVEAIWGDEEMLRLRLQNAPADSFDEYPVWIANGIMDFIKQGDVDDAFKLAELLLHDKQDLINKATGWMLRFAGDQDRSRLLRFLDEHAATMPRVTLRYTIEHLDKKQREHYMHL